jgi:2-iminobutanoate/2-iminopropanoate deaminase
MEKENFNADLPSADAPFNLCVRYGDLIFVSGLPPFDEPFSAQVREARANKLPLPPFPAMPFADQVHLVMGNMKKLVEEAGSNMDCLLKVIVWLKDQRDAGEFDRIYRTYFSGQETLQAGRTPMDCGLEVEAIAYVPKLARVKPVKRALKNPAQRTAKKAAKPAKKAVKRTASKKP